MEIVRIIVVYVIGFLIMFVLQPVLFTNGWTEVTNVTPEDLIAQYNTVAFLVFIASMIATFGWYSVAAYYNDKNEELQFKVIWAGFSLLPFVTIVLSVLLLRSVPFMAPLFLLDILFLFWFGTAISTPGRFKYAVVPGSYFLRHLPFLK